MRRHQRPSPSVSTPLGRVLVSVNRTVDELTHQIDHLNQRGVVLAGEVQLIINRIQATQDAGETRRLLVRLHQIQRECARRARACDRIQGAVQRAHAQFVRNVEEVH